MTRHSLLSFLMPTVMVATTSWIFVAPTNAREPFPIDPLWASADFRRAFTGAYGTDGRIEPGINTAERDVLDTVATKMRANDRTGAIATLSDNPLTSGSAALLFSLGSLHFEDGNVDVAVKSFEKALAAYPNFRDAHRNLAIALVQQAKLDEAEPHLIRSMELGSRDGLTLGLLGYIHASHGRHQAALQAYRLAQLTMPSEAQWKLGEAHALLALNDPRASASIYGELLSHRPADANLWMNQADAYLQIGESPLAIANLEFARRLGKIEAAEIISLGHLYLNETMTEDAVACYREALTAATPAPFDKAIDAIDALSRFQHWTGARELADLISNSPAYAAKLASSPETPKPALRTLARFERVRALIELETGDATSAAVRVEALVKRDPLDADSLVLLARFREKEKRIPEAEMLLEQAARDPEHESAAMRALGEMRTRDGRYAEAIEPLKQALRLAPDPRLEDYLKAVEQVADLRNP
ncbi:MAG: tetratricopeptide repeat protein [Verrucomicrobiae bacterium]|nr:tetratricopeptide repeat protein [Verrucomicrobiae bacterium]